MLSKTRYKSATEIKKRYTLSDLFCQSVCLAGSQPKEGGGVRRVTRDFDDVTPMYKVSFPILQT